MKRQRSNSRTYVNRPFKRPRSIATPEAKALKENTAIIRQQRKTTGRVELKVTYKNDAGSVTTSGVIDKLTSNLSRGTSGIDNFLGLELLPTSVRVNVGMTMGQSAIAYGDGTNFMRVLVFQWLDSTTPAIGGILQDATSPFSMTRWENRENIMVLADRLFALKQTGLQQDSHDAIAERIYIKGKRMVPIKYNAAGSAVQKGDVYIIILSDSSVTANPYVVYNSQITFTDA